MNINAIATISQENVGFSIKTNTLIVVQTYVKILMKSSGKSDKIQ